MGYKPLGSSHHDNNNNNLDFINYTQHHCAIRQHVIAAFLIVFLNVIKFIFPLKEPSRLVLIIHHPL
jgi:hypothetical protein